MRKTTTRTTTRATGGRGEVVVSWRVARLRLEEANMRRFLKARPIECVGGYGGIGASRRREGGVRGYGRGWQNLGTPYVSKKSGRYIRVLGVGEWVSWDHYPVGGRDRERRWRRRLARECHGGRRDVEMAMTILWMENKICAYNIVLGRPPPPVRRQMDGWGGGRYGRSEGDGNAMTGTRW